MSIMDKLHRRERVVVLLSGGMDSAVCLAWAIDMGLHPSTLFFDYGQRHRDREWKAAKSVALHFGILLVGRVELQIDGESSLTGQGPLVGSSVVVPGRNAAFLRAAAADGAERIVMGCCRDDHATFEDCRPEFFAAMSAELGIPIETPLLHLDKPGVVRLAQIHGGTFVLGKTWSCYAGGDEPCGKCGACEARLRAFPAGWR